MKCQHDSSVYMTRKKRGSCEKYKNFLVVFYLTPFKTKYVYLNDEEVQVNCSENYVLAHRIIFFRDP